MTAMVMVAARAGGGSLVGVIAKRTYRVAAGRCFVADEQLPLVEEPRFSDDRSVLLHDLDCVLNRGEVDVVVEGSARPPGRAAAAFELRVRVGGLDRRLSVFGDRRCYRSTSGRLRFREPAPVEEVPLDWTSSYGGFDRVALERHGDPLLELREKARQPYSPRFGRFAYPRNRAGKGYLIEPTDEALEACELPNLEEPSRLLSPERLAIGAPERWPAAPPVAAVGWLSYANFPRAAMLGIPPAYDAEVCPPASFFEVRTGALAVESIAPAIAIARRLDLRVAQQSAPGMRVPALTAGSPVSIVNAHPSMPAWEFALSSEVPMLALQIPGARAVRLEPRIRTVHIQPDLDRVSVVWVGEQQQPALVGPGKRALIKHAVEWRPDGR
ncbi:MAG TPA: DUF2169 domain-containing protein [Polyangia bacterium]|nr:DUF2169 domain-containing protein [Polyangia bacterium]